MPDLAPPISDSPNDAPNGLHAAKVDDKGRLKLPVKFQEYLAKFAEKKLYITSIDEQTGQIYDIATWRENRKLFNKHPDPKRASRVSFLADVYGDDGEVDAQGRLLLPVELRRLLGCENQTVRLRAFRGHIEILNDALYQQRKLEAGRSPREDADEMYLAGMQ